MLVNLICLFVVKPYLYLQRRSVGCVSFLALFDRILHVIFTKLEIHKLQTQLFTVVADRRDVIENFLQPLVQKPLIGVLLNLDEVRHLQYLFLPGVAHPETVAVFDRTYPVFLH